MKNQKHFIFNRVVTRNFFYDMVSKFQNFFGMNLTYYEKMLDEAHTKIFKEIMDSKIKLKWFRFEHTELKNGALVVTVYGEKI